jgi:hypothetical protein
MVYVHPYNPEDLLLVSASTKLRNHVSAKLEIFHGAVQLSLVEKHSSIPVRKGHLHRFCNRYKRSGTKGPPFRTGSLRTGINGASTWAPRRAHGEGAFVLQTGTKSWLPRQEICMNLCRGREFMV